MLSEVVIVCYPPGALTGRVLVPGVGDFHDETLACLVFYDTGGPTNLRVPLTSGGGFFLEELGKGPCTVQMHYFVEGTEQVYEAIVEGVAIESNATTDLGEIALMAPAELNM